MSYDEEIEWPSFEAVLREVSPSSPSLTGETIGDLEETHYEAEIDSDVELGEDVVELEADQHVEVEQDLEANLVDEPELEVDDILDTAIDEDDRDVEGSVDADLGDFETSEIVDLDDPNPDDFVVPIEEASTTSFAEVPVTEVSDQEPSSSFDDAEMDEADLAELPPPPIMADEDADFSLEDAPPPPIMANEDADFSLEDAPPPPIMADEGTEITEITEIAETQSAPIEIVQNPPPPAPGEVPEESEDDGFTFFGAPSTPDAAAGASMDLSGLVDAEELPPPPLLETSDANPFDTFDEVEADESALIGLDQEISAADSVPAELLDSEAQAAAAGDEWNVWNLDDESNQLSTVAPEDRPEPFELIGFDDESDEPVENPFLIEVPQTDETEESAVEQAPTPVNEDPWAFIRPKEDEEPEKISFWENRPKFFGGDERRKARARREAKQAESKDAKEDS